MVRNQIIIDELEAKADAITVDADILQREVDALAAKGKAILEKLNTLKEKQIHYRQAANNLKIVDELDEPPVIMLHEDPWGEAGEQS